MQFLDTFHPAWPGAAALGAPLATALAAIACRPSMGGARAGQLARAAAAFALAAALLGLLAIALFGPASFRWLRFDLVGGLVLLLVAFIGWVIARFSRAYLEGEAHEARYARWLLATLTGATLVVVSNDLLLLAAAWWGTSLALQQLLLFYPGRPAAAMAAHKKLVLSRIADLCMLSACALLYAQTGNLRIDTLTDLAGGGPLALPVQAAVLLVALTALLKCAQLPFHGWLIQVMEAPTPVSALLHAGVVNLGGFVLLRLSGLVDQVPAAQLLLVAVGTTTAVAAALVMSTRISVKVSLAWSTCAQMGFMLMQCGLGLWKLALLHLLAHSLYKAHAFLGAGGIVRDTMVGKLARPAAQPGVAGRLLGAAGGLLIVAGAAWAWNISLAGQPALWVMGAILALALNPFLAVSRSGSWLLAWALAFGLAWLYFALHQLAGHWVLSTPTGGNALWLIPAIGFAALFVLQTALHARVLWTQRLYPWFYGGFFLDERVSRLLFRMSPPPTARKD